MHILLLTMLSSLVLAACPGPPYHFPGQYPDRPARIACSSCHADVRRSFDHKRGWCDDHSRYRRHDGLCAACHQDTACMHCHRDPSGKLIWSDMR
jgi:hypothetical protein